MLVDALHRRVVHQLRRAQSRAVDEAGIVADHLGIGRERSQLLHECRFVAAIARGREDRVEVVCRPRREEHQHDQQDTGRSDENGSQERERRHDRGQMVSVQRGLEHQHQCGHSGPGREHHHVGGRGAPLTGHDEQRDQRNDQRGDDEQIAAPERREELAKLTELRVARAGPAVVRDRLAPHVAESPRQRRCEPHRDGRAGRDREMVDATT